MFSINDIQDNIDYHIKWLQCARDNHTIGNIDYIGNWFVLSCIVV